MKKMINIKMLFALFLLIGFIGISAQEAKASHLRGVTISWAPTGNPGEVEFRFLFSERQTWANRTLGSNYSVGINFGDGTSGNATGPITSINTAEDYMIADLKVRHTYAGNGPYTAQYSVCCRIGGLGNGGSTLTLQTIVTPRNGNNSPTASIPTVITVPSLPIVSFSIPASDADGDRLRYRLATTSENGGVNPPNGMSIDANTGVVTWNTAGLNISAGRLFTAQVMIEDLDSNGNVKSKIPVDFIIKFVGNIGTPPTISINPAGPLTVSANSLVSFTVTGNDADTNARVTLNAAGIPAGGAMTPAIGAQLSPPVTSTFNWTPTLAQAGPTGNTYVINFTATDENNNQALKSITVNVLPVGAPTANSQSISAQGGVPQNVVLTATDPNGLNLTFSIPGAPGHGTAVLNGSPSCSVSGGVSTCTQDAIYTANPGYNGPDLFTFRASNGVQNSNAANVNVVVASNQSPTINCPASPTAVQYSPGGANVPITFQVADPNGDALTVQWKVNGSVVHTDNVAASNQPTNVTLPGQYAVGNHTVQAIVTDPSNSQVTSCVLQITVMKADQTISFGALADKTFGDADFSISATASSNLPVSFASSGNCTVSGNTVHITGAGICLITASQAGDANYNAAPNVSQSFTIAKATPVVTWANPANITYGTALSGTQLNATASVPGTFAYAPPSGVVLNAGTHNLSVIFTPTDSANYNTVSTGVSINVLKATPTLSVTGGTFTFDNIPHPATGFAYGIGGVSDVLTPVLTFSYLNVADNSVLPGAPVNSGIYKVTATFAGNSNYNPVSAANAATIIIYSDVCVSIPSGAVAWYQGENNGADIIGGNNGTPIAGANFTAGEVGQGFLFNGSTSYFHVNNHSSLKMTTMMSVSAWINPAGNGSGGSGGGIIVNKEGEYEIARFGDGTIRWAFANTSPGWTWINTGYVAPLNQWTHVAVTYAPGGTIRTYANGVLVHTVNGTGVIGDVHTNANDFRIGGRTIPSSTAQNFDGRIDEVQIFNRNLTEAEARGIYLADGRGICPPPATLTAVVPKITSFSPSSQGINLDATVTSGGQPVNAGTVNFTVTNSGGSVIGTVVSSNVSGGAANAAFTLPGGVSPQNLTISAAYNGAAVYQFSSGTNTLTINKADPTITWANPADITYGAALSNMQLNALASVPGNLVYTPASGAVLSAGTHQLSVNFTPTDTANYNNASASVSVNVLQAALTIKADDKTKTYGDVPVSLTVTPNGFVNGDTMASLGGTLAFNFADAANKPAGTYAITPSGLTSNNYAITFVDGTLTVNKAALTVTADNASRLYGQSNPTFTGNITGVQNSDNITASYATTATQLSPVGSYPITSSLSDPDGKLGNYNVSSTDGTLTVDQAALTVAADNKQKTYGDTAVAFTATYTGLVNGETPASLTAVAFNFADAPTTPAGTHTIIPNGVSSPNYTVTFENGTLTVNKAPLSVTADDKSRQYGTANPAFTGSIVGVQNGEDITASYTTSATSASNVDSYAIVPQASGATLSNYDVTYHNGTLAITKAPQAISWSNPADIIYGTALGASQLNAVVSVVGPSPHGAVIYTPAAGTVLNAGNNQTLSVSVAGTNNYELASANVLINVAKSPSAITASAPAFIANGGSVTLSGILTGVANVPLAGRSVTLSIGSGASLQSCTAITEADGGASCSVNGISQPLGPNLPVSSAFGGDSNYLASSGSTATLVFAYAVGNGGSFVIGDKNSAVGTVVTFWGSQWANKNSLTGGAAPNSFKGFANRSTTTPASCGATWTTDPGTSSNPPLTIPAYMAVIVSSSIDQPGSTISGNTPKVVIVKTNAGYGPSSGKDGTGTVVGVLCQ